MMKRCIDLVLACIGLLLVLPFFPLIGLLIKLDSWGPVLYRCDRIGKDGKLFKMYKFRTMFETTLPVGASVCPEDDPRVTPFGRILRRTKINELPQLLNVLKGEMTFVGPRPEAPDLAALYPDIRQGHFYRDTWTGGAKSNPRDAMRKSGILQTWIHSSTTLRKFCPKNCHLIWNMSVTHRS